MRKLNTISKQLILTMVLALSACVGYSQEAVEVATLKFKGSQNLFYGFAAGDKIILNCSVYSVVNNKKIEKELEGIAIFKAPDDSKPIYSDLKIKKNEPIIIDIPEKGIYQFCFNNKAAYICSIHIQRIPASEATKNFNTTVVKKIIEKRDTIYETALEDVVVGYDTTYEDIRVQLLEDSTRISEEMKDYKPVTLHSINSKYPNKQSIRFTIPKLKGHDFPTQRKELMAWVYWIGVGEESQKEWNKNVNIVKNLASGVATIVGAGPLAALAIGAIADFAIPTKGDCVSYRIYRENEKDKDTLWNEGILAYGKELEKKDGNYIIELKNNNKMRAITVDVKISLIWKTEYYKVKKAPKITPRTEQKPVKKPRIKVQPIEVWDFAQ